MNNQDQQLVDWAFWWQIHRDYTPAELKHLINIGRGPA